MEEAAQMEQRDSSSSKIGINADESWDNSNEEESTTLIAPLLDRRFLVTGFEEDGEGALDIRRETLVDGKIEDCSENVMD